MLAIRLPKIIENRLQNLAKLTRGTKSFYARAAIIEYIDDLEDLYLAKESLSKLRTGRIGAVLLEDLIKEYGLED